MKNKPFIISLIASLLYVSLGTITVMVHFPDYSIMGFDYNSIFWIPLVILTLPVNILLFGLVTVDTSFLSILILQIIAFLLIWFVLYKILNSIKEKRKSK